MNEEKLPKVLPNLNSLVVFAGPGISASSGVPTRAQIVDAFQSMLEDHYRDPNSPEYMDYIKKASEAEMTELFKATFGTRALSIKIKDMFAGSQFIPTAIHHALAKLPMKAIITTNFDTLLEQSFSSVGRAFRVVIDDIGPSYIDESIPLVIKLNGSIERPSSISIRTINDYADFLSSKINVYNLIRLILSGNDVIFIGYSVEDPEFKSIYQSFRGSDLQIRNWFVLTTDVNPLTYRLWIMRGVSIIELPHEEVVDFLEMLSPSTEEHRAERVGEEAHSLAIQSEVSRKGKNVLIVASEPYMCERMAKYLSERSYNTVVAISGEDSLDEIQNQDFDLVIVDRFLSDDPIAPTGLEYLGQIKREQPNIKALLMNGSAWPLRDDRVDAFLLKPFTGQTLLQTVEQLLIDIPKWDGYEIDYDEGNTYLREQIDIIGIDTLKHILLQLYPRSIRTVLQYLSPGFSRSTMLRGCARGPGTAAFFVLKISKDEGEMLKELQAWENIRKSGMPAHNTAALRRNKIASSRGWYAIAYERIGIGGADVRSFGDIYQVTMGNICQLLENIFNRLNEFFYVPHQIMERNYSLWQESYEYDTRTKVQMLNRFGSLIPYLKNILVSAEADEYIHMIEDFIRYERIGPLDIGGLDFDTVLSYVHGDLNSRNVLFVDSEPIFIDFASFDRREHIMTDYCRMEAEIKFTLMGMEDRTDMDLGYLAVWAGIEAALLNVATLDISPRLVSAEPNYPKGVKQAYELIGIVRRGLQNRFPSSMNFETQYLIALLHHTLKYLIEPNVTDAKRFFAVCSAIMICGKLRIENI